MLLGCTPALVTTQPDPLPPGLAYLQDRQHHLLRALHVHLVLRAVLVVHVVECEPKEGEEGGK